MMDIALAPGAAAEALGAAPTDLDPSALSILAPVQLKRRGVERRLVLEGAARPVDGTLLRAIAQGLAWAEQLRSEPCGVAEIARREGLSRTWVARHIDLSILSPRIIERVARGEQPPGLTAAWLLRNPPPPCWAEQERRIAAL